MTTNGWAGARASGGGLLSAHTPPWTNGVWRWPRVPDRRLLALAVAVQALIALLSVRTWPDARVFQAAGYLVGTGHSPYAAVDLGPVFHSALYAALPAIGYPPPWPLLLGGIYRVSYALHPDVALYGLAIKVPVIAAGVGLAYLAAATLHNLGGTPSTVRRGWIALLFNPLLIFVGAAWGQIDAIVALLAFAALLLALSGRRDLSAVTLALAVCFKPTAVALVLAVLLFLGATSALRALRYAVLCAAGVFAFYVLPFLAFGWDAAPARSANAQLSMAGAMSYATIARLWRDPLVLEGHWWLLGILWVPALLAAALVARRPPAGAAGLLALGTGLTLVFFLCRTWLSEPNVILVLAPVLVLSALGRVDRRLFTAIWAVTLAFAVSNASPVLLLWPLSPDATRAALAVLRGHPEATLLVRVALVVAWQVVGWWTAVVCLRRCVSPGVMLSTRGRRAAAGTAELTSDAAPLTTMSRGARP
jgi:hypothetical protein